ncbi:MAG: tRNA lysidine(34) synthetase TilS [Lentisphaerae bacterium]|nr:tRNA lysidine(34) synthetase TilS [Lentisphaerota bacterium]
MAGGVDPGHAARRRPGLHAVRRAIREGGLLDGCRCLLLGVSGGADSVAMAHLVRAIVPARGPRLVIAHLHHGIRGASADRDAAFVRRLAERLGVRCVVGHADVPALARARRESIEMAARAARHGFFRRVAEEAGADRVALAHTADDQAETVLLRLCRGAGSTGLSAMLSDATIGGLRVVRPLLGVSRAAIEAHLRGLGERWRTDPTNRSDAHLRNRVRRRVIPVLERELNPSVRDALCTAARLLGDDDAVLEGLARRALRRPGSGAGGLDAARLCALPVAIQRRAVREWILSRGAPADAAGFAAVGRVRDLAAGAGASATLGRGWTAIREGGEVRLERARRGGAEPWMPVDLRVPGRTEIRAAGLVFAVTRGRGFRRVREPGPGAGATTAWLDAGRVAGRPLTARPWRAGDRYRPARGAGRGEDPRHPRQPEGPARPSRRASGGRVRRRDRLAPRPPGGGGLGGEGEVGCELADDDAGGGRALNPAGGGLYFTKTGTSDGSQGES